MPRLDRLPALDVIRGLKGILDFYYWKGIPCVRKWPVIPLSSRSPASMDSARLFGAIIQGYALLGGALKTLFAEDAADQPRTARDLFVSAMLGHLHEPSMSDFLDLLTQATAYLAIIKELADALLSISTDQLLTRPAYDGGAWQALLVDAQRHLQTDVLSSALPTDAATAAHQVTQNTALALIQKLEAALESVHTNRLLVRGMDQLFSFKGVLHEIRTAVISGAGGFVNSDPVPAGTIWHLTRIATTDQTNATTSHQYLKDHAGNLFPFDHIFNTFAAWQYNFLPCNQLLTPGDFMQVWFAAAQAGDTCAVLLFGYEMTLET